MKHKIILLGFLVFSFQLVYSQTEKRIKASVVNNDSALHGIEVLNLNNKSVTITNNEGVFSILAKGGDQLMFISKKYQYKTITLQEVNFLNTDFVIHLIKKPEELEEVVITKFNAPKITNIQSLLDKKYPDDAYSHLINPLINDGSIPNGPDINRIIGMIVNLFIKKRERKTKEIPEIKFKQLALNSLSHGFFEKYLKLKPEEMALFLELCDADPKSKNITENPNVLSLMDFLFTKNEEFKKLQSIN